MTPVCDICGRPVSGFELVCADCQTRRAYFAEQAAKKGATFVLIPLGIVATVGIAIGAYSFVGETKRQLEIESARVDRRSQGIVTLSPNEGEMLESRRDIIQASARMRSAAGLPPEPSTQHRLAEIERILDGADKASTRK